MTLLVIIGTVAFLVLLVWVGVKAPDQAQLDLNDHYWRERGHSIISKYLSALDDEANGGGDLETRSSKRHIYMHFLIMDKYTNVLIERKKFKLSKGQTGDCIDEKFIERYNHFDDFKNYALQKRYDDFKCPSELYEDWWERTEL